ncbi:MAG: trypsin-like peptidase domain-containing protein [Gemmatimonadota bacterium]|jgi:serine protease Do|nr:trypsin-like peptidase domain-containing protein [Gemmatimonadota bacterium]MDQ8146951.1 trypsin-like peptidase domain-containing protein [Gemmatimonadota bacterium]MDQ8148836.1 trypsin-like peptidase domain-containing protein [Gemmatimonadota bacterium]MDQ8156768.1 trypsin-like peptidase domain-containing protein [Gemmatimonadota bacterium]MDQ8176584.1 trypsin-like peptidase domain-containing protein [Gemmatimonadota bacterium]
MSPTAPRLVLLLVGLLWAAPAAAQGAGDGRGLDTLRRAIDSSRRTVITTAVARVAPAVVTVQTERVERTTATPLDVFFGARPGSQVQAGIGSGFIIDASGVIVTNAHVVQGASRINVALRDGTTYPATLVGADELNDIAVLRIDARGLPTAPLGNSRDLLLGEWVVAIGNPFGFLLGNSEPSVTVGVVSGVGRNLTGRGDGPSVYVDMIQTDASINPGNSGGPLISAGGEVIGVNSSIYSPTGGSVGLGFAIPIDRARRVTEDLLAHGTIRRPWIGAKVAPATPGASRGSLTTGATIDRVVTGSPAAEAGLRAGDVIVRSRDRAIRNAYDWEAELLDLRVGERVPLQVRRGAREERFAVQVKDLPEVGAERVAVLRELELITLTAAIRAERGVKSPQGAVVVGVSDRVAQALGIRAGDVIVQINNTPVTDAQQVAALLQAAGGRGPIRLFLERAGAVYSTDFRIS